METVGIATGVISSLIQEYFKDMAKVQLVATDLDGTFLKDDKSISSRDLKTLLAVDRVVRVAATGRSLFKVKDVVPESVPFDYIVFSSGAGVYDWRNQKLLHAEKFEQSTTVDLLKHLLDGDYNFFIFDPIPNNNKFFYHKGAENCREFQNYLKRHKGDYRLLKAAEQVQAAGQVLVIIKNDSRLFEQLKADIYSDCEKVRVIRATSPVNDDYIWLEIFPETVSKGHGIQWLCDNLKIPYTATASIGNDYNDLDMFRFVKHPFIVRNGADDLKKDISCLQASNNESAFTEAMERLSLISG